MSIKVLCKWSALYKLVVGLGCSWIKQKELYFYSNGLHVVRYEWTWFRYQFEGNAVFYYSHAHSLTSLSKPSSSWGLDGFEKTAALSFRKSSSQWHNPDTPSEGLGLTVCSTLEGPTPHTSHTFYSPRSPAFPTQSALNSAAPQENITWWAHSHEGQMT